LLVKNLLDIAIAENYKFSLPGAMQEQIKRAVKQANAHDFIVSFPNGYGMQVAFAIDCVITMFVLLCEVLCLCVVCFVLQGCSFC